jgi:2-dehydro-3-deoxygluconokinase
VNATPVADVVTLGECMALAFPPEPVGLAQSLQLKLDIAGAESNLCIGLSRLGVKPCFISRVGADPFGLRIRQVLDQEGVDTSALLTDSEAPTGVFFREHLPDGQRRVYYYRKGSAASRLSPDDLHRGLFQGARLVHLTGITPALSPACAAACQRAIELARQAGARISFDPNFRPRLWNANEARAALLPLMSQADILLLGHEDAQALFDIDSRTDLLIEQTLQHGLNLGASIIVLKLGEQGACALAKSGLEPAGQIITVPAHPVEQVIDPVGAGDGFDAGFIAAWLRGWNLEKCLQLGARLGAAAVGVMGDYEGYPRDLVIN